MTKFDAIVTEDVPAHRLMYLTRPEGNPDVVHLKMSTETGSPEFVSTRELAAGERVIVRITNSPTWTVEAGEDVEAGVPVVSGPGGVVVRDTRGNVDNPSGVGYTIKAAKQGDLVEVVRFSRPNLQWAKKVNQAIDGGSGE